LARYVVVRPVRARARPATGVRDGLVAPFVLQSDPAAVARLGMPGPCYGVTFDVRLAASG